MANGNNKPSKLKLADNGIYADRFVEVSRNYICFSNSNEPGRSVPAIYMSGRWIRQVGFRLYDLVRVRVIRGCITLTVENE